MQKLSNKMLSTQQAYSEKVLQFGTGNFLRAFVDFLVSELNEKQQFQGSVVVVQSTNSNSSQKLQEQDQLYTLWTRGKQDGQIIDEMQVIDVISRTVNASTDYEAYLALATNPDLQLIVSNTTEAGIYFEQSDLMESKPAVSFGAKLTHLLYARFQHFNGAASKCLYVLPTELIENNGDQLKRIVLQYANYWQLEPAFAGWLNECIIFCNTLVDRIVPGFPKAQLDEFQERAHYVDELAVMCEPYLLWAIEERREIKSVFPIHELPYEIHFVEDIAPYRLQKVRILNGSHTALAVVGALMGVPTVRDAVQHVVLRNYLNALMDEEIIPATDMEQNGLLRYKSQIFERFENDFIDHYLESILLNSVSKFNARLAPIMVDYYERFKELPSLHVFALSCLMYLYGGANGKGDVELKDNEMILAHFNEAWQVDMQSEVGLRQVVTQLLDEEIFELDRLPRDEVTEQLISDLQQIIALGLEGALKAKLTEGAVE